MMSVVFMPTRSLPPCGFSFGRPATVLPGRSLVVCAGRRYSPDAAPYFRPSIPSILKSLNSDQASVAQVLESQSPYLRSCDGFAILEGLGKQNKWTLTLEVFRWIQRQKWYKHDDGFYSKLIVIMGKAKQLRMAVWLFNEVRRSGARPDTSLYNALITAYLFSKDKGRGFEKALKLFEEMKKKTKCQPNLVTYNILLRASAQACDVARVEGLFKEMEAARIYPDNVSYNGVIGAYGKAGDYVQMEKTLFVMRMQKHIKPDNVTSNTLIESYGRGKDFVKMEQVLKSMSSSQSRHKPDLKTYNIVMSNYARVGEVEKMEWSLERMEAANYTPNLRSYEILMTGYGDVGAFTKMRACFYQLLEAGIQPQLSTLNTMISAYCQHNLFEEAEELLSNAMEWQIRPRTSSHLIILR
ncbi:hypothetical protein KC19_1G285800 [Ceratodon purpureus]|nr:hypothetical protein KC19_1G285800 [Ceratodon purpureus]